MEAVPQTVQDIDRTDSVLPQAIGFQTSGYIAPEIVDLGAWQVVTGSVLVPCDPFGCDVEF